MPKIRILEMKLLNVFKSRKFWAALIGTIFLVVDEVVPEFPLSVDQVTDVVYLLIAYILGVAIEDAGARIGNKGKA